MHWEMCERLPVEAHHLHTEEQADFRRRISHTDARRVSKPSTLEEVLPPSVCKRICQSWRKLRARQQRNTRDLLRLTFWGAIIVRETKCLPCVPFSSLPHFGFYQPNSSSKPLSPQTLPLGNFLFPCGFLSGSVTEGTRTKPRRSHKKVVYLCCQSLVLNSPGGLQYPAAQGRVTRHLPLGMFQLYHWELYIPRNAFPGWRKLS